MSIAPPPTLDEAFLTQLVELELATALSTVLATGPLGPETVHSLISAALDKAESSSMAAERWIVLANLLNERLAEPERLRGDLHYAQARLYTQRGQLPLAETALRAAQAAWQQNGDTAALTRSQLGLTQVLAMQGRHSEAEASARSAVSILEASAIDDTTQARLLAIAHRNLATVLVYQERHQAALTSYARTQQILEGRLAAIDRTAEQADELHRELAHLYLNQASAHMFLDRVYEAEAALHTAIDLFDRLGDRLNRGRGCTNLGVLYLRNGRYAAALSQFDRAARDLIDDLPIDAPASLEQLRNADILLLDQATAYLALNLLPEADEALGHCTELFRSQPYEFGQTRWAQGMVRQRLGDPQGAEAALLEANQLFGGLGNRFWQRRVTLALAALDYAQGEVERAARRLATVFATATPAGEAPINWDQATLADAYLLQVRLHLAQNDITAAAAALATLRPSIGPPAVDVESGLEIVLPQVAVRLNHAAGLVAQGLGDQAEARRRLRAAINLLERQRATLSIEEVRAAFLDDKTALYSDLVLNLLAEGSQEAQSEAFAIVEQARSRALLERLQAALSPEANNEDPQASRRQALQQELHLLYNQLLGESGSRNAGNAVQAAIHSREALLQRLEWRAPLPLAEAKPVDLVMLQRVLAPEQQALVFCRAGDELLAFVVSQASLHTVRHLCTSDELMAAVDEWHFQLGRAEISADYRQRHAERFAQSLLAALRRLYDLILAPLAPLLQAERLLLIPHGVLHQVPLHAVWAGERFFLELYECSYAPSASLAVQLLSKAESPAAWQKWAGLGLDDPAIPGAQVEIETVAGHFSESRVYLGEAATLAALHAAAQEADILHLATHGLFRPDNPFCSVLKLADGWADVKALYRLKLAARLVVLSACESGAVVVRGGDETIGLARGFLAAGACALIVSLWNVHDASVPMLMASLYRALAAPAPRAAAALRTAQLESIHAGRHPYEWAPYIVIGA